MLAVVRLLESDWEDSRNFAWEIFQSSKVIRGIGIVNHIYFNYKTEQFWIIDYRIYDPDTGKKTKIDDVEEMMLNAINNKGMPFKTVLMDSLYATQRLMASIDNLGKIYYFPLKSNPLVKDIGRDQKIQKNSRLKLG